MVDNSIGRIFPQSIGGVPGKVETLSVWLKIDAASCRLPFKFVFKSLSVSRSTFHTESCKALQIFQRLEVFHGKANPLALQKPSKTRDSDFLLTSRFSLARQVHYLSLATRRPSWLQANTL